jgi:hypothetical protein
LFPNRSGPRTDKLGFATPEYFWLNNIKGNLRDYFTDDLNDFMKVDRIKAEWDNLFLIAEENGDNCFLEIYQLCYLEKSL